MKVQSGDIIQTPGVYKCTRCGAFVYAEGDKVVDCTRCGNSEFELQT